MIRSRVSRWIPPATPMWLDAPIPPTSPLQLSDRRREGYDHAFVAKIDATGSQLILRRLHRRQQ